jgi:hypothetical protein
LKLNFWMHNQSQSFHSAWRNSGISLILQQDSTDFTRQGTRLILIKHGLHATLNFQVAYKLFFATDQSCPYPTNLLNPF